MAAVATAVAPTMMMGVGKENVARAMAGSYAQMQQKVAAINKESYCAKIDATKADAVASYAQLCTIFKSIKAKYLAASTRLHFLNLLSADEPKQEIAADTNPQHRPAEETSNQPRTNTVTYRQCDDSVVGECGDE